MRIGGAYSLYDNFNSQAALNRIKQVDPNTLQSVNSDATGKVNEVAESASADSFEEEALALPRKNADVSELADSLKSDYNPIGRESDIKSLDVMQAVSDMQKDATLQQYQYFVGSSEVMENSEDGIVIQKTGMNLY